MAPRTGTNQRSGAVSTASHRVVSVALVSVVVHGLLGLLESREYRRLVLDFSGVRTLSSTMLGLLVGTHISIEPRLDPDLGLIDADPSQLDQVIVNLVVNAADALPQGGTITLSAARAVMGVDGLPNIAPGDYVTLTVRDDGLGMDEETLSRAFEPFFTTKPPGKGTGLGLSTVYGIVKQSGAHVWIDSKVGAGTTVTICFAAEQPTKAVV